MQYRFCFVAVLIIMKSLVLLAPPASPQEQPANSMQCKYFFISAGGTMPAMMLLSLSVHA